jgi:integrase
MPIQMSKTIHGGVRAADKALAAMVTEMSNGRQPAGSETVATLLDKWLTHLVSLGRSATTIYEYRRLADKVVIPALGKRRLDKLTARDLDKLYDSLTERGLKPTSVRRVHALLSASLHQAEKWNMVKENVARRASPPPVHAAQVTAPSPEAVQALIKAADEVEPMYGVLIFLAAISGCRRGELCGLQWSDVDWENGTLTVTRSIYETRSGGWAQKPTKTHGTRRIALGDVGVALLRRHRAAVDKLADKLELKVPADAFMFSLSPQGSEPIRPDLVTRLVLRISRGTIHVHQLRHYSASQLIAGGHDVRTVAGRLGHADASVTLRVYAHVLPERDREAAAALGRTLTLSS